MDGDVMMTGEMSLDVWHEKNDQNKVDGMWQEVYSKGKKINNKKSDL